VIELVFEKDVSILLYGGGPLVYLILGFGVKATLDIAMVRKVYIAMSFSFLLVLT
jgi:hypothetical protein